MKRRSSALVVALLCAQAILNSRAEGAFTPLGSFNDSGLEWRASVGCHRYGPGCWIPGFAGTDASPLAHDGGIVIGSYDGHLYHVAADGTQIWNATLGNSIGYSAVGEGTPALVTPNPDKPTLKCFVVATLDSVKCLSVDAATVVWSWTPAGGGQVASCGGVDAARGLVFVGTLHRKLYAVRTQDGTTAWTYDAGGEIWATHGPRIVGEDLVCSGAGGEAATWGNCSAVMHCVNRSTGSLVWKHPTGKQIQSTPAVGALGVLYIGDYDDCLYAFTVADGTLKWRVCTQGRLEASPAVTTQGGQEVVIIGSGDGNLYAFEGASGQQRWATRLGRPVGLTGGGVGSTARISQGIAYVGGPDALWAINVTTGQAVWRHHVGAMVGSSPALSEDHRQLYVGAEDGYLYAFNLEGRGGAGLSEVRELV